ncbi:GcrA cell cycle regulator [Mesorhizobium sp. INR15]|uniref:GcrA cell cycle regulator n=1 Tax=Mesorhizobium sp. INR15 TaxID=2654248 RepID=UPI00189668DE|nr:GcrA cell cycle regulator [Mesorhizobium sp. INR15]QPC91880.1 GcrA cell cycle regulator [Mesorhizobium sp. INR15]
MPSYIDSELQAIASWLKDGLSASGIAAEFSALRGSPVSRNAIIGIVHRNAMLAAIGFANGKGVIAERAANRASHKAANEMVGLVQKRASGGIPHVIGDAGTKPRPAGKSRREPPPAWLPPRLFVHELGALPPDGEAFRFKVPVPQRPPVGRQPHGVAMRFIDCLFGRCRAPLDLTLEEDPEKDAPGGRPGEDMLCCGMHTRALKSYCEYHQACFRRRIFVAQPV